MKPGRADVGDNFLLGALPKDPHTPLTSSLVYFKEDNSEPPHLTP